MRRHLVLLTSLATIGLLADPLAQRRSQDVEIPPTVAIEKDVMVPARDGVRLATDIYRPAGGGQPSAGRFPVIVERTPYDKEGSGNIRRGLFFAQRGYVVVYQDVRGRFKSEGRWWMLVDDDTDGYDLLAWIAKQPWSNGRTDASRPWAGAIPVRPSTRSPSRVPLA
jgi:predicted acyl esterase